MFGSARMFSNSLCAPVPVRVVQTCSGDSRAVLSRGEHVLPLSDDHRPDRPDEQVSWLRLDHMF